MAQQPGPARGTFMVQPDAAPAQPVYRKIGGSFVVGKAKWAGPVIASPDAIYLLKVSRHNTGAAAGAHAGGLIGALVVGAISAAFQKPDETKSCKYFELPREVREHPDWPVKKQKKDVDVIVLPKPFVEGLRHPRFGNLLKLTAAGIPYTIEYTLFRGRKVKAFLAGAGWTMQW
jgi:hypothetical protein